MFTTFFLYIGYITNRLHNNFFSAVSFILIFNRAAINYCSLYKCLIFYLDVSASKSQESQWADAVRLTCSSIAESCNENVNSNHPKQRMCNVLMNVETNEQDNVARDDDCSENRYSFTTKGAQGMITLNYYNINRNSYINLLWRVRTITIVESIYIYICI